MRLFTSTFTHTQTTTLTLPPPPSPPPPHPSSPPTSPSPQPTPETTHEAALSLLHDPTTIITLNPLVTHFAQLDPNSTDLGPLLPSQSPPPPPPSSYSFSNLDPPPQQTVIPERRKFFRITDSKPLLGGWYTGKIEYCISYLRVDGGCDTVVCAPGGVRIEGSWRLSLMRRGVSGGDVEEELRLVEKATVTCPSLFAPFIKATLGSSHGEMHQRCMRV